MDDQKLDQAVLMVARMMNPKSPETTLRRWLRYLPSSIYPFIICEYRRLIGSDRAFEVYDQGFFSTESRELARRGSRERKKPS